MGLKFVIFLFFKFLFILKSFLLNNFCVKDFDLGNCGWNFCIKMFGFDLEIIFLLLFVRLNWKNFIMLLVGWLMLYSIRMVVVKVFVLIINGIVFIIFFFYKYIC